jgi:hypothetical protein
MKWYPASSESIVDVNLIKDSFPVYNVTEQVPLQSGYYADATARAAIPDTIRKKGLIITYATAAAWTTEQFYKGERSDLKAAVIVFIGKNKYKMKVLR